LIEAIVAAGLVATAALGTAQLFALATAQNAFARQQLVMSGLASAKIDELAAAVSPASYGSETISDAGRSYQRQWRITEVPGYGVEAVAITVVVSAAVGVGGEVRLTCIRAGTP